MIDILSAFVSKHIQNSKELIWKFICGIFSPPQRRNLYEMCRNHVQLPELWWIFNECDLIRWFNLEVISATLAAWAAPHIVRKPFHIFFLFCYWCCCYFSFMSILIHLWLIHKKTTNNSCDLAERFMFSFVQLYLRKFESWQFRTFFTQISLRMQ